MQVTQRPSELTAYISRFAVGTPYEALPSQVIERGKIHILDTVACGMAGCISSASDIVRNYVADLGCTGRSTVIGGTNRLPARFASLLNGIAIHADDFDDTAPQPSADRNGGMHSTGSVVGAALALAEQQRRSGRDFMLAVHIGVEVACKLNHAVAPRHYESGYHATSTINVFGVAAAAGRLLGLDEQGMSRALGIAASHSSGLREHFGTMVNAFHSGHAAESGVVSAELAAREFTAAENILESPRGFFNAAAGGYDPDAIMGRLGSPWAFDTPGMWIKPYPCGALTHPAVTAIIDWAVDQNIDAAQIDKIEIRTNRRIANTLIHNRPETALQAKFSMPFCVAAAVLRRRLTLAEFTDDMAIDPNIQALIDRTAYTTYDAPEPGFTNVTTLLDIALNDGRRFHIRADYGKGNPKRPMGFDDIAEKLRGCANYAGWNKDDAEAIIDLVATLDGCPDMALVASRLARRLS